MKILIVNDDGYASPGIVKLASALCQEHKVVVMAPTRCNSGMAHAMTFNRPIYLNEIPQKYPYPCYSVSGTPADCVKLGTELMALEPPDLVISGINTEPNIGTTVVYSGTANAAMEASLLGVPSIAVSGNPEEESDYEYLVDFFLGHLDYYLSLTSKEYALNININNHRIGNKSHKITPLGRRLFSDVYIVGAEDINGKPHTLVGSPIHINNAEDCDVIWYGKGYATITPLTSDNTMFSAMRSIKAVKQPQ